MSDLVLRDTHLLLFKRYAKICAHFKEDTSKSSPSNLYWMTQKCMEEIYNWPIDKLSRWLGFIQGCLACKGLIDVDAEREYTRPYFHEAYAALGLETPKTSEKPNENS
jgi:hypothetical protein